MFNEALHIKHAKALDEVKRLFVRQSTDERLSMVDSIQRLGIEYHFEDQIEATLQRKYTMLRFHRIQELSQVAFQFRMLRQQGYYIRPDIFDIFWDNRGKLKDIFYKDINGLIALFVAYQLRIEGEDYLESAGQFFREYLNEWCSTFHDHAQVNFVAQTLMCHIQMDKSNQKIWDPATIEQLPDCIKACFKALYDTANEFALRTHLKTGWNPISSLIKSWIKLLNAFLQEAKWFAFGHVPTSEEYLKNAIVSTGVHVILVHAFFCMGQDITDKTVSIINDFLTIISTIATIIRLCNETKGDKVEKIHLFYYINKLVIMKQKD
ncbi:hypothetical protein RYX36_035093 [Vicia faba]